MTQKIKERLRKTYEAIAPHFDATRQKVWPDVEEFLKKMLRKQKILDFGSGTGRHSILAQKLGHDVVAMDFAAAQMKMLRQKNKKIKLVQGDVCAPPFKPKTFGAILYVATVHHLPSKKERLRSLQEAKKLLRPKGKILISAWAFEQEKFKRLKKQDVTLKWARKWPRFYHLFARGELKNIARKAGFKVERAWLSGDNYWVKAGN